MNKVEFTYNDDKYFVQCNAEDKIKDVIFKFMNKVGKQRKNMVFLYNGLIINEELTFNQCANRLDKSRNNMNVIAFESQGANEDPVKKKKSNYIICPQCKESAYLSIKDFKISITDCKEKHKTENLELKELGETQMIDQSKIYCDKCHTLKSDTIDNKFFICNTCKMNLCPRCCDEHDNTHKNSIIDYEDNQFFCKAHYIGYSHYCKDCKKDLCPLCLQEHEEHYIIAYQSIMRELNIKKDEELKDIKEKIYQLKTIINGMVYQLNNLNKNLNIYFEIYDNIISSYDINKINYCLIQNINNMKKYNKNFIGNLTEMIKDNNLKTQFTNIIALYSKIVFKRKKQNEQTIQNGNNIIIIDNNNNKNNDNNSTNKEKDNNLNYQYKNFSVANIKELYTYTSKNDIEKLLILKDGRIVTNQSYYDENGDLLYKLCVYSLKDGFICDINMDFNQIEEIYELDDGNVIVEQEKEPIKIIKIKKNDIEEIYKFKKDGSHIKKLFKDKFLIEIKMKRDDPYYNKFFQVWVDYKFEKEIFTYDNKQLIFYKNIQRIYDDEKKINNICQINENELIFYARQKGKIYGENDILIFYDMKTDNIISKLTVGKGENDYYSIKLINMAILIISGEETIIFVDIKNRKIIFILSREKNWTIISI